MDTEEAELSCSHKGECACGEDCQCKNTTTIIVDDILPFLTKLFGDKKRAQKYHHRIVTTGQFGSLSELEVSERDILMAFSDTIPGADLDKIIKALDLSRRQYWRLFFYVIAILYMALCIVLLRNNKALLEDDANNATDEIRVKNFHIVEFTIPPLYILAFLLVTLKMPALADHFKWKVVCITEWVQFVASLLELMTSVIAAVFIYLDQERFETEAHYLEYSSFLFLSFIVLAVALVSRDKPWKRIVSAIMAFISIAFIIVMIVLITQEKEFLAHYFEFSMELLLVLASMITVSIQRV